jgi:hypothetical protein
LSRRRGRVRCPSAASGATTAGSCARQGSEYRGLLEDLARETGGRKAPPPPEPIAEQLLAKALALGFTEEEARALWVDTPDPP